MTSADLSPETAKAGLAFMVGVMEERSSMAHVLYRLGKFAARHRAWFFGSWALVLVALALVAVGGAKFSSEAFQIPGAESTQALKVVNEEFASVDDESDSLTLVFRADSGTLADAEIEERIASTIAAATTIDHVVRASDPFDENLPYVSSDQTVAVSTVTLEGVTDENAPDISSELEGLADDATGDGLTVAVGGTIETIEGASVSVGEIVGVLIAFVVLVITFGSLLAAGANMLGAVVSVGLGMMAILGFSAVSPIQSTTPILAAMLGLAVAIDYGLFVLARFRTELRHGHDVEEAIGRATGTAGTAVVFAGSTVIVALLGLAVVNIPFITEMGVAAAVAVFVAVAMTLTFMPPLMRSLGRRALGRRERRRRSPAEIQPVRTGLIDRWGATVVRHPVVSALTAIVVLLVLAIPVLSLQTALVTPGGSDPKASQRIAYDIMTEAFGAGSQDPLVVLVEGADAVGAAPDAVSMLQDLDGVSTAVMAASNEAGTAVLVQVIPTTGPLDPATTTLIHTIREHGDDIGGVHLAVTGSTAISLDTDEQLSNALVVYLCVVVGLSFILLVLMFRSLLVPLMATVGFLLSLAASLGIVVAIFQWGWLDALIPAFQGGPILSLLPIIVTGIVFGLAMDYQVFLVSRMREAYVHGQEPKAAILAGFRQSAPVVVAAASIMTAVFGGFAFSESGLIASMGFALAGGVIADAFVVRMIIVPGLLSLAGKAAWWLPRWLDRILPDLDAEGRSLETIRLEREVRSTVVG